MEQKNNRRLFLLAAAVLLTVFAIYITYNALVFRVVSTNPKSGSEVSSSLDQVILKFNKDLDPRQDLFKHTKTSPEDFFYRKAIIQGKNIILELGNLRQNENYEITLREVVAANGKKINNVNVIFKSKYVPFKDLPKDQQERSIKTVESEDFNDPIFNVSPYETSQFSVSASMIDSEEKSADKKNILVNINIKLNSSSSENDKNSYKSAALSYLSSRGINLNNYIVNYSYDEVFGPAE